MANKFTDWSVSDVVARRLANERRRLHFVHQRAGSAVRRPMGKAKKERAARRKARTAADPLALVREARLEEGAATMKRYEGVNSLRHDVREAACAAVGALFLQNDDTADAARERVYHARLQLARQAGLVKNLIARLSDAVVGVRLQAAGALR